MQLEQLIKRIKTETVVGEVKNKEITAIRIDSRIVGKGELFVALTGGSVDGHNYIHDAVRSGAVAIVCERATERIEVPQIIVKDARSALARLSAIFYGEAQKKLKIIGVTGTNGKTTTCQFLTSILKKAGKKVGVIGTLGISYADVVHAPTLTTPDSLQLFSTFADMVKRGIEYVVMEVSAHAVYYEKIDGIRFLACVFTNCTQDHLDFFESMERYAATKKKLFDDKKYQYAVVNVDDDLGVTIASENGQCKTYALESPADNFALVQEETIKGSRIILNLEDELCETTLCLTGRYNVYNALAAASCARVIGIKEIHIAEGLHALKVVDGRLERAGSVRGGEIFVDFAHTPDGLKNALNALKVGCKGKLYCVFGCGGNRDTTKREIMGEIAGELCDFCVLTSDNPRYEEPYAIISAIEKGYRKFSKSYVVVQDRRKAIEYAMRRLNAGDVLLVAGKGAENYQEIMGIKYDYNDKEVIKGVIKKLQTE